MDLDNIEGIKKLDGENVLSSIDTLSDQCLHAWEDCEKIVVSDSYKNINKIVMCGMGGSGLGARVIESVYGSEIKVPLTRVNDYHLPKFVDSKTLVICSSYSGETEETITNLKEAIAVGAKWMAIGAGNTLIKMAEEAGVPFYKIDPTFNPSNQPRMAIGYSVIGQLVLASKAGVINFHKEDLDKIIAVMKEVASKVNVDIPASENEAKKIANLMKDKITFFVSAGHLIGAMHVVNNQANENAKHFTADYVIPELNHHLMEGMGHPTRDHAKIFGFFANSSLYSEKITKRFAITEEVCQKQNIEVYEFKATAESKISQVFELIQFGAYADFYLSMLYDLNPAPIPWVDFFKEKLGQPLGK